jgi:hypothetical protein
MKWGLLERAWKDLLTGGSTDIEELDYSDTSLSFNVIGIIVSNLLCRRILGSNGLLLGRQLMKYQKL